MLEIVPQGRRVHVRFDYDPARVHEVKAFPGARWNAAARRWEVPAGYAAGLARALGAAYEDPHDVLPPSGIYVHARPLRDGFELAVWGPYERLKAAARRYGLAWDRYERGFTGVLKREEFEAFLAKLRRSDPPLVVEIEEGVRAPADLPDDLQKSLWPHQADGVRFVLEQWALGRSGALLYWEMGTGKTLAALALARAHGRVLVLAPRSVVPVWAMQAEQHFPGTFTVLPLRSGSTSARAARLRKVLEAGGERLLVVTNYESFWRGELWKAIQEVRWDLVVLDESHRIKSPYGKASKAAHALGDRVGHKLLLTGTPMPHGPLDVWSQFRFLAPGVFGKRFTRFRDRYAILGPWKNVQGFKHLDDLRRRMALYTHRVRKEDVLDLPPIAHQVIPVELDAEWKVYHELFYAGEAILDQEVVDARKVIVLINKLAQVTSGFVIDRTGAVHRVGRAKADALADFLEDLPQKEPVVVFARYQADLDLIREVGEAKGRTVLELSGRKDEWEAFAAGEGDLIAVQFRAGALGVDLTRAAYAVIYSQTYALGDYEQALARLHRPGQTRPVTVYHLIAQNTIDEHVYRALEAKADVVESVVRGLRRWRARALRKRKEAR